MGADSRGTYDGDFIVWCPDKLWTYHDGRVGMATAGAARTGQELRHEWEPPALPPTPLTDSKVHDYLVQMARSIEDHMHNIDHIWSAVADPDDEHNLYGSILVAFAGRIVWISGNFTVNRVDPSRPFCAIGSGGMVATGSLDATHRLGTSPREQVTMALDAAVAEDAGCGAPFVTLEIPPL
jgi:hypothetical protein